MENIIAYGNDASNYNGYQTGVPMKVNHLTATRQTVSSKLIFGSSS